ncbi:hypothetical protein DS2_03565 [Catenovulum agarivorans DS-2]|uniref:Lipoprotein n=1 Tax=Catenovulum agarivorans DS-2 TaxID=1328313 RepID=W7R1N5_9ALTE|nr:lipoprotein [Catenovulum agarivorans]EWH11555.1 hypothetical protein DS2_03565 [Catenovulum agarivorans DS-2]
MFRRLGLIVALLFICSGCSKVTADNYNKIKVGMALEEVETIIGAPDECSEVIGTKQCMWGDNKRNIKITFVADVATLTLQNGLK